MSFTFALWWGFPWDTVVSGSFCCHVGCVRVGGLLRFETCRYTSMSSGVLLMVAFFRGLCAPNLLRNAYTGTYVRRFLCASRWLLLHLQSFYSLPYFVLFCFVLVFLDEGECFSDRSRLLHIQRHVLTWLLVGFFRSNDSGDLVVTKGDQYDVREAGSEEGKGDVRNLGKPVDLSGR